MHVLVACEFSGVVREAFIARGHDAWSCDLMPALWLGDPSGRHVTGDVRPLLRRRWDLVIAHPPCTYLTSSGVQFLNRPGRRDKMRKGVEFFRRCLDANSPRVCVENPLMCGEALRLLGVKPSQTVHPWQFGHGEKKTTCLWLRGLPNLAPTNMVDGREERNRNIPSGRNRGRLRSITYAGIAAAMGEQWGAGAGD